MNKDKALQFANEFIDNLQCDKDYFNISKPVNCSFNQDILSNDPNLEILNSELNKIGFKILEDKNKFVLAKI